IPIEGDDFDLEDAFDLLARGALEKSGCKLGVVAGIENSRASGDLQSLPSRIVHQEEAHAIVLREVACRDELPIAAQVGERELASVERVQESRRSAAVLQIRPPIGGHRRQVEAVAT